MQTVWFTILSVMLAVYVVLDGFDFGAGILHLFVAKKDPERRSVLAAIGPVWDGNEVWLLASGGILVFAFPKAYAAGFSGFYLPLMVVLWLLILRGLSIELRSHQPHPLWRSFWDGVFAFASTLMAIFLGAALGNVIRGVGLNNEGYFSGPLFTDFRLGPTPGVLDWYTVIVGIFTLVVLAAHGAVYLTWKTDGVVHDRSRRLIVPLWAAVVVIGIIATIATASVRPEIYSNLVSRPWTFLLVLLFVAGIVVVFAGTARRAELAAFLGSAAFIAGLLAATAAGFYPNILISRVDPAYNLTIYNASAGALGLRVGLAWWTIAIILAIGYFTYLFRSFRGKVAPPTEGHGY